MIDGVGSIVAVAVSVGSGKVKDGSTIGVLLLQAHTTMLKITAAKNDLTQYFI